MNNWQKEKQGELDAAFNKRMKTMEHYGQQSNNSNDSKHRTVNGSDYEAKIRQSQKEAMSIIMKKQELNKKMGIKPTF